MQTVARQSTCATPCFFNITMCLGKLSVALPKMFPCSFLPLHRILLCGYTMIYSTRFLIDGLLSYFQPFTISKTSMMTFMITHLLPRSRIAKSRSTDICTFVIFCSYNLHTGHKAWVQIYVLMVQYVPLVSIAHRAFTLVVNHSLCQQLWRF